MAHSFAHHPTLQCPECGRTFAPEVWLIIDAAERPDLLARVREGTIHHVVCPNGHGAAVDTALLIYRPGESPPILFSPSEQTTPEQDGQIAGELLRRLAGALGEAWRDDWLDTLRPIPRAALAVVMDSDDPLAAAESLADAIPPGVQAALAEIIRALAAEGVVVQSPEDLDRALAARPALRDRLAAAVREAAADAEPAADLLTEPLTATLRAYIETPDWIASYRFLLAHPELLTDAADERLAWLVDTATAAGRQPSADAFAEHRALLQQARAVGAARAYAAKLGATPEQVERLAADEPLPAAARLAYEEVLAALRAEGITVDSPAALQAALAARPALAARLQAALGEVAGEPGAPPGDDPPADPLLAALQAFVEADTWLASYRFVNAHPELLTDAAEAALAQGVERATAAGDERAVQFYGEHLALLRRARAVGAAQAFAEKLGTTAEQLEAAARGSEGPDVPLPYRAAVEQAKAAAQRYRSIGDLAALDEAAAAWGRVLDDAGFPAAPEQFQLGAFNDAAIVFIRRYQATGRLPDLDRALALWQDAVRRTPDDAPEQAAILNNLGNGLRDRYARTGRAADLDAAIAAYDDAVRRTPDDAPDRAGRLNNLGNGQSDRYARTGDPADLARAIDAWEDAVARTPPDSPDQAGYQNNLGNGLRDRYARTGDPADLARAIDAWENAVARTPPDSPDRAMYQNNLGNGLRERYLHSGQVEDLYNSITAYKDAIALESPHSTNRALYLNNLGAGLNNMYALTNLVEDLDASIDAWQQASRTSSPYIEGGSILNNLGNGLHDRYSRTGRAEDLDAAITSYREALTNIPLDSPDRPIILSNLGTGLSSRYERFGNSEDLDTAITICAEAISRSPDNSPTLPGTLNNLGNSLRDRYEIQGTKEDLNAAIAAFEESVARTPVGSPDRAGRLSNLGAALLARYMDTGNPATLDKAIESHNEAIRYSQDGSVNWASIFGNLGAGLIARYDLTGNPEDLDAAVSAFEESVSHSTDTSTQRATHLNNLGTALHKQYKFTGELTDLSRALSRWKESVDLTPIDSPSRASILSNLGSGLLDSYTDMGQVEHLDAAINTLEGALACTPENSLDRASVWNNLGQGLRDRYWRTSRPDDLNAAIDAYEITIATTPADSPNRAGRLSNLGLALHDRYIFLGRAEDLDAAVAAFEDAARRTPPNSPDRLTNFNNLGIGLRARYERSGDLNDLVAALEAFQAALDGSPSASPDRGQPLNNLGLSLQNRYEQLGHLQDLDAAIIAHREAVDCTPANSLDRAICLSNLGFGLRNRFTRTQKQSDLRDAMNAWRDAIALVPADSPMLPGLYNNIGTGLGNRYAETRLPEDLDESIASFEAAIASTDSESPRQSGRLSNLGLALHDRYTLTGKLDDLNGSIATLEDAVSHSLSNSPTVARYLKSLGLVLSERYARTGRVEDLDKALALCREATQTAFPMAGDVALQSAQIWSELALRREAWDETIQATAIARDTLRRLDEANVLTDERLSWRREVQGLAAAEATAHARLGDARAADLALETGQAQTLNAALGRGRDRALLARLRGDDPPLFAAYEAAAGDARAAQRLGAGGATPAGDGPGPRPTVDAARQRVVATQAALDGVIARVRARPGYEDLFAPLAFDDVAAAVGATPLAYLATTPAGSVVLLLHRRDGAIVVEPLWAELTDDELDRLLVRRAVAAGNVGPVEGGLLPAQVTGFRLGPELAAALPALGARLMAPLAARLRELSATAVSLIPGGRLNLLPLHAATYVKEGAPVAFLDEFAVAFAPSAEVAARGQGSTLPRPMGEGWGEGTLPRPAGEGWGEGLAALVVGNPLPLPPGVASLRFALEEAATVAGLYRERTPFAGRVAFLPETAATLDAVSAALPGRAVLHFACHGAFDSAAPLDSGLLLADGEMLTLRQVRDSAALVGARLVVLSACQTGLTDFRELPDEVIGLPAGFLTAGAAGVAGSLWPVDDRSTALLMGDFHRRVLAGEGPAAALRAAQRWLRGVTRAELGAYYEAHIRQMSAAEAFAAQGAVLGGGPPNEAPFAAPTHWAAFTFNGA